ncbi:AI-2E family transporter [Pontibacter harenae]|uniref:AI-2E family transporter n=1 Tax=Pontibacter harenae TaxID=2894083 RepID=UPI001E4F3E7F|nr:AI-2E family transporter [Pontibacter harenae]MCC9167714.1 AI-2E family transporter [Pontibacter harenae]
MKTISIYRANAIILLGILTVVALHYGKAFFIPLFFSIILSMLMLPVSKKLESWGMNRLLSTLVCILIILLFIAVILFVISAQAVSFSNDLPQIQNQLQQMVDKVQQWIQQQFGVAPQKQIQFVQSRISSLSQSANNFATSVVKGLMGIITSFALVMLYMLFLLWQRDKYKNFSLKLVKPENKPEANRTISSITEVASAYLVGRLISMLFLAVFYSIGFSVVGLQNPILLSIIAVLPTIVPYVGAVIGGLFPLIMAFVSGSTGMVLPVIGILAAAQLIDNNLIEPFVMGAKMDLSPLITVVAIVLGELIWGIAGMILFVPMFAIIRIVCEHLPALHPYGYLLEDELGEPDWVKKLKNKFSKN